MNNTLTKPLTIESFAEYGKTNYNMVSNKRLWIYGVLFQLNGKWVAKAPGQHVCVTKDEAIKYAANDTMTKVRGLLNTKNVIFCVDMTEQAIKAGYSSKEHYAKYDDFIRPLFPNYKGTIKNDVGGASRELLVEFDENETREDIELKLVSKMEEISKQELINPSKIYSMRRYMDQLMDEGYSSDKSLIAGCTGSGKETSNLTLLISRHDKMLKENKIDETTLHVGVATVPSTIMELIKELTDVKGMIDEGTGKFYDYSRFKVYMVEKFKKSYYPILNRRQKIWFKHNVNVVGSVGDIPPTHTKEQVPLLLGSFHDLGLSESNKDFGIKLKSIYVGLDERIGILSIGEAHKFLSNSSNKMWSNINELKRKHLLLVTGTPYDYIFNEGNQLYFTPEETALFTWDDLCREKISDPDGPYGKYPDVNYYGLPDIKETLVRLKADDKWEDDVNGWTWRKLLTTMDENENFLYSDAIVYIFDRLLGRSIGFDSKVEGLSIHSAPELCDEAKRHIIMRLPSGQNNVGVSDYIPKLMKLLVDKGVASDRDIIEVYDDGDVGKIKEVIVENKRPTLTLTCTKYLTGTDIPQWGSVIFLAPIGDSIKLFEQIVGRVKRPFKGKKNCGVFIGSVDDVINIHVSVEQLVSMMRGKDESFKDVLIRVLENYNVFTGENDSWKKLDFPDLVSRLEALSVRGNYGVRGCIKELKVPDDFDLVFKSSSSQSEDVVIVDNGMTDAKDLERKTLSKQLQLFEKEFKKEADRITFYRNMVKKHLSKVRVLCYLENLNTLQEGVEFVVKSINENNSVVLDGIGKGVELIPYYMLDKNQINIPHFNRWVHKINSDNISLNGLLELLASKELEDEDSSFYPTPVRLFRGMIEKFLGTGVIENPVVIDYVAGRGTSLITLLEMYKEKGIEVDTSNIYYNDIDPYMVKIFKKINKEYKLGIPEENIFNEDVFNPSQTQKFKEILMKEFDYVLINPPFSKNSKEPVRQWSKFIDLGRTLRKHSGGLGVFSPSTLLSSTNSIHDEIKDEMIYTNVSSEVSDSFTSRGGSQKFIYSIFMGSKVNKCVTKFDEVELEFNPTSTPIAPIKSSSYFIYDLVEKLYNSNFPVHDWYRVDVKEVDSAVVVPMAKAISFKVQFMDSDDFEIGRYKLKISKEFGENIAHNLNTKIYRILRWVLRSGPALAGNFKLLPIPIVKINDEELFDKLNLDKPTREYIKNYVE